MKALFSILIGALLIVGCASQAASPAVTPPQTVETVESVDPTSPPAVTEQATTEIRQHCLHRAQLSPDGSTCRPLSGNCLSIVPRSQVAYEVGKFSSIRTTVLTLPRSSRR
jgi:hypothetical protein